MRKNTKSQLIIRLLISAFIGIALSLGSYIIFLYLCKANNLPPFYKGLSPSYFEVIQLSLLPLLTYSQLILKERKTIINEVIGYLFILTLGLLGWTIGIYETITFTMINDPNDTFYLGYLGAFDWHLKQKYFTIGIGLGSFIFFILNKLNTSKNTYK